MSVTTTSVGSTSANNYLEAQKLKRANQERLEASTYQLVIPNPVIISRRVERNNLTLNVKKCP